MSFILDDAEPSVDLHRQRLAGVCTVPHTLSTAGSSHEARRTSAVTKLLGSTFPCRYVVSTDWL